MSLSSKPEVKNAPSLKNVIREREKKKKTQKQKQKEKTKKQNKTGKKQNKKQRKKTIIRYQKKKLWKGFSSTKNSYLNHLLQDLEFKQ